MKFNWIASKMKFHPRKRHHLNWQLTEATRPQDELAERVPELADVEQNPWFVIAMARHRRAPHRIRPGRLVAAVLLLFAVVLFPLARIIANPDYSIIIPGQELFGVGLVWLAYAVLGWLWIERAILSPSPGTNPFRYMMRRHPALLYELYRVNSDPDEIAGAVLAHQLVLRPRHAWISRQWLIALVVLPACLAAAPLRETTLIDYAFFLPLFLAVYRRQFAEDYEKVILSDLAMATWIATPRKGAVWEGLRRFHSLTRPVIVFLWNVLLILSAPVIVFGATFSTLVVGGPREPAFLSDPWVWCLCFALALVFGIFGGEIRRSWARRSERKNWSVLATQYINYLEALKQNFDKFDRTASDHVSPTSIRFIQWINRFFRFLVWHTYRKVVAAGMILVAFSGLGFFNYDRSLAKSIIADAWLPSVSLWDSIKAQLWPFFHVSDSADSGVSASLVQPGAYGQSTTYRMVIITPSAHLNVVTEFAHTLDAQYPLTLWIRHIPGGGKYYREVMNHPKVQEFTEDLQFTGTPEYCWASFDLSRFSMLSVLSLENVRLDAALPLPASLKFLHISAQRGKGVVLLPPISSPMELITLHNLQAGDLKRFFDSNGLSTKRLIMNNMRDMTDLRFMTKSHSVTHLQISSAPGLHSLDGIEAVQGLRTLRLNPEEFNHEGTHWESAPKLDALLRCESLRIVDMEGMKLENPEDLRVLAEMDGLETFKIDRRTLISKPNSPSDKNAFSQHHVALEAAYIETKVRWNQVIEDAIQDIKTNPEGHSTSFNLRGLF